MPLANFSLEGKVAVVTGASRGIGEAIARAFAEQGATVVICSRKLDALEAVAASIRESGGKCTALACHTGDGAQIAALFDKVKAEFGRVDILVNNAATNPYFGPAIDISEGAFDKTVEVNIKGYFLMMQHAGRMMVEQGGGAIVNIASIAGIQPGPMQVIYSMTKAAVISLTKGLARELGGAGVRVNAIAPGVVETKFAQLLVETPEIREQFVGRTCLGRHAQPNEMVGAAVFLASDAASYVTGEVLVADGGFLA